MRKAIMCLLVLTMVGVIITGCEKQQNGLDGPSKKINIATATTGGSMYPSGVILAQLLSDEMEIKASASTSAGSVENISLLMNNEAQIAFIQNNVLRDAFLGEETFQGKEKFEDLRIMLPIQTSYHYIVVRKDAGIERVPDLKGKRYIIGRPGSGGATTAATLLDAFDLKVSDVIAEGLGQDEAIDALKNGQVDAALIVGGLGLGSISDLLASSSKDIKIINYTKEDGKIVNEKHPWIEPLIVPANTFLNQPEDILVTAHIVYLATTESALNEDEVYEILETTLANREDLIEQLENFNNIGFLSPEKFLDYEVPLHDGAKKYFKEKGYIE